MAKKAEHKQQRQYCNNFNKDFKNGPHKTFLKTKKKESLCWRCQNLPFLACFLASLIAQLVKNPPTMQEILVQLLGWEDPLEKR